MASYALGIFLTLYPFLAHSESGDYALSDTESSNVFCSSMLSFILENLTCRLADEDIDDFDYATLCETLSPTICVNGTLENDSFSFQELSTLIKYHLRIYLRDGSVNEQNIDLVKIVKIPTPELNNVTYSSEQAYISIGYKHDYVSDPLFHVEIWGTNVTHKMKTNVSYKSLTIGGDKLRDSDIYYVRVKAKPVGYFDGSWTDWSPVKSFRVKHVTEDPMSNTGDPSLVTYIVFCTSLILVVGIWLLVLRWKKEIQAYISPNIPNPKATLAQIHREKERPPVSFSPEMFSDVNINRVDYAEEKQFSPELDEGQEDTGSCQSEATGRLLDDTSNVVEVSHLKIRLLDQPEEGRDEVSCQSLATLQRDCRDESYVTMSSLYKTQ